MSRELPVVAAIPNYNMAASLANLVPQLLDQSYDAVYVLDDASTDHSREVVEAYDLDDVHFVAGEVNRGAGGNRSRILEVLEHHSIIHFLDADMELESDRNPEKARELLEGEPVGFVGGLIKDAASGRQSFWNYGPRQCLHSDLTSYIQGGLESISADHPELTRELRKRLGNLLSEWPNPFEEPHARYTFWNAEANIVIDSKVFELVGGYDPNIKNHEIQDLAIKLHNKGLRREFNPLISGIHTAVQVREGSRTMARARAELAIARKNGLLNWLFPEGQFKPGM